jgi:WD40 repeat protein
VHSTRLVASSADFAPRFPQRLHLLAVQPHHTMATVAASLRGRPAHAPGPAYLTYTPDGTKLITVGTNGAHRIFTHNSDAEPATIDVQSETHTAVVATNDFFIVGSEDGHVTKYSLLTQSMDQILVRCSMPVRDLALSRDGEWCAVASDELEVKVVNTRDMEKVMYLRDMVRPVKHVSFDVSGTMLAASSTDGIAYMYSLSSEQPVLVKRADGLIKVVETDSETTSKCYWHPDGRAFAVGTAARREFHPSLQSDDFVLTPSQAFKSLLAATGRPKRLSLAAIEQTSVQRLGHITAPFLPPQIFAMASACGRPERNA